MPIYEFHCEACNEGFEVFVHGFSQKVEPKCPKCGGQRVRKKMSGFMAGTAKPAGDNSTGGSSKCSGCRASSCVGCRR